uniref:Uncharacterized protein n=1 Tax=Arundo donax TaxID=35708 RepID=A0A0A9HKK2_ARUDO
MAQVTGKTDNTIPNSNLSHFWK